MENSRLKLFLKSINLFWKRDLKPFIINRTKLYFLPITAGFILNTKPKENLFWLMSKNNHYGFLIETIVLKLEMMRDSWPDYKFDENEKETLDLLISKGSELLDLLEEEDVENHIRTKKYLDKQKYFFDMLNVKLPELFY